MDSSLLPLSVPLLVLAFFCTRLLVSPDSRSRARENLVRLASGRPRGALRVAAAGLLWLASLALAVQVTVYFGAQAPEALPPLRSLALGVGGIAAFAAGCVWILGASRAPFWPPDGDRRLSQAAQRLGVSTEEAALRAIDVGLPQLKVDED